MRVSEASRLFLEYHKSHSKENSVRAYKLVLSKLCVDFGDENLGQITTERVETGQPEAKWWPLTPPNPFCCNPEEYTVNAETYKLVQKFRPVIETSGKKHTKTYLRVLEEIERGTDVGQADEERLGVQAKTIASRKHEMQVILQNYVAEHDNEVDQRLKNIKALRKKKRKGTNSKELKSKKKKCKKSTFNERKALYRDPYAVQHKPKTKRDWSVVRGRGGKK